MNIYLIGYRCTGKTTVGRWVAERLGWDFFDSDEELVGTHGMTIRHIVAAQGWEGFREKERRIIKRICGLDRCVIATGGGVVLDPENVRAMKATGTVFWLRATPETIRKRMRNDEASGPLRPSLTSTGADQEVEEVLARREPLYRGAAEFQVETDGLGPESIGQQIAESMKKMEKGK